MQSWRLLVALTDPIHEGHLDHILKASKLGNYLIIITHPCDILIDKKGYCLQSYKIRATILEAIMQYYDIHGRVVMSIDIDGTVAKTLEKLQPDIFAKGGDRDANNMPQNELEVCNECGIEIIYGQGDLLGSSSKGVLEASKKLKAMGKI